MIWCLIIVILIFSSLNGTILENALGERSRAPTDVWMEAEETAITVHWVPPTDLNGLSFCILAYKAENNPAITRILMFPNRRNYTIDSLQRDTLYEIKLYCLYGEAGPTTGWLGVATRTVSVEPEVCPGTLPNAILEPFCLEHPRFQYCEFTCQDGYRKSDVPNVLRGYRKQTENIRVSVSCVNGTWVTYNENLGYGIDNICLPEAEFQKCPLTIPNGALEPHCGPATDWLCAFTCNEGFHRHRYTMSGSLKYLSSRPDVIYCDDGTWRTGYEELGVDISGVCVGKERNCTDSIEIPNGRVPLLPCPAGYTCAFQCDEGFHRHALAQDSPNCENGHWGLRTTKYDSTVTPQTICVPDDARGVCPQVVPHGRIANPDCEANCWPDCDEGYYVPGRNEPRALSCEGGKWLTGDAPYTGDNICFPDGGYPCPVAIPNGISTEADYDRTDDGTSRLHIGYKCNAGYRRHRTITHIECIAGEWVTAQERLGLGLSTLCIPY